MIGYKVTDVHKQKRLSMKNLASDTEMSLYQSKNKNYYSEYSYIIAINSTCNCTVWRRREQVDVLEATQATTVCFYIKIY